MLEYDAEIKKNKMLLYTTQMNLINKMLNGRNQTRKIKHYKIHLFKFQKN